MSTTPVPIPTLRRLPRYHQYLARPRSNGQEQVSASRIAVVLGVHRTQVLDLVERARRGESEASEACDGCH